MSATAPISALTVISIVVAVLGMFVAGDVRLVALGMVGLAGAGLIGAFGARRAG